MDIQTHIQSQIRQFDLNYEDVLEHWSMAHAVREVIANALDEEILSNSREPSITKDEHGVWHVRDFGRGIRYEHLTQNENKEKQERNDSIIGKFGIGLKDALATCDRHNVVITIRSKHGDITIGRKPKHDFSDLLTLHATIAPPSEPNIQGTDIALAGVSDDDVQLAKSWFLRFSGDRVLETNKHGAVLAVKNKSARIYVNGLLVAEESDFLFSYNITSITPKLRNALNRERTNVGRTAYTDRVKAILLACKSDIVLNDLTDQLDFGSGTMKDELLWQEISQFASRILNSKEKVIFVTPTEMLAGGSAVSHAQADGYRVVTVSDSFATKMPMTDITNRPMVSVAQYSTEWNKSFEYKIVSVNDLSSSEKQVYSLTSKLMELAGSQQTANVKQILISETMRLDSYRSDAAGVWESHTGRIIIKRSELASLTSYAGVLMHEITHSFTDADDETVEFEDGLSKLLGVIASHIIN